MFEVVREEKLLLVIVNIDRIDGELAADFKDALSELISGETALVLLDLNRVSFIDSSGLAAIVYCFQMTAIKEELVICCVQPRVMRLFELTRMNEVVRIFPTREQAKLALSGGGD